MNHYEAAETAGRKKLKEELPYLDFEFSSTLDRTDFKATNRITGERITGELKAYINAEHKRYSTGKEGRQYEDYWIDYDKCIAVKEAAAKDGSTPVVVAIFMDKLFVWYLNEYRWENRWTWQEVTTASGQDYRKKTEIQRLAMLLLKRGHILKEYEQHRNYR